MDYVPIEIYQLVFDILDLKTQIGIMHMSCNFYRNLIIKCVDQPKYCLCKLSSVRVIKLRYLQALNIEQSQEWNLHCCNLNELNLFALKLNNNPCVTNISHMLNLRVLYAKGEDCAIDQKSVESLNLVKLDCSNNYKIKNVSHMNNLRVLHAEDNCGIGQNSIDALKLSLTKLCIMNNNKIINLMDMPNLKFLRAIFDNIIFDHNNNLVEAYIYFGYMTCYHMHLNKIKLLFVDTFDLRDEINITFNNNLKVLISMNMNIVQNDIKDINLSIFSVCYNTTYLDLTHMTKLRKLYACSSICGISNSSILGLKLLKLYVYDNKNITRDNNMASLKVYNDTMPKYAPTYIINKSYDYDCLPSLVPASNFDNSEFIVF